MSTYWDMGIFRTLSKIYDSALGQNNFNYFCKTLHLKSLRGFWISVKCVRILNIPGLSICQSSGFPGLQTVYLFLWKWQGSEYESGCNYGKVLIIPGFQISQVSSNTRVTQVSEYASIWLNNAWINCSDYSRVLHLTGQSFTRFWICL